MPLVLRRILAAPDKFRGTATAREICAAIASAAREMDLSCDQAPMADGGEGTLDVVEGSKRRVAVRGPLGEKVDAEWIINGELAVIEMARASGLLLAGGAENNRPLEATTAGTGELISAAIKAGAREVIVGVGGSATTDGGLGAIEALRPHSRLRGIDLTVAVDVDTLFVDAARVFAPQKGATEAEVALLERRLFQLANQYQDEFGIDIRNIPGSGAAGGLAGGLAALGASIRMGFEYLADVMHLDSRIEDSDLVITGEGCFDSQSLQGKVVGGVISIAQQFDVPAIVIAGSIDLRGIPGELIDKITLISLVEEFGNERAVNNTTECVEEIIRKILLERIA